MLGSEIAQNHKVVRKYKAYLLAAVEVFDFIPASGMRLKTDQVILRKWEAHFQRKGVPYIITKEGRGYGLWKKLEAAVDPLSVKSEMQPKTVARIKAFML